MDQALSRPIYVPPLRLLLSLFPGTPQKPATSLTVAPVFALATTGED